MLASRLIEFVVFWLCVAGSGCCLGAQGANVIANPEFPRLARSLDHGWYQTSTQSWLVRAEPNFGASPSILSVRVTDEITSQVRTATLSLPFNRNGNLIPIQTDLATKYFLVCGGCAGPSGVDGKLLLISAEDDVSGLTLSVLETSTIPNCDPLVMVEDCVGRIGHGPLYVMDYVGRRVMAGIVHSSTAHMITLPTQWMEAASSSNCSVLERPLETWLLARSFLNGDDIAVVMTNSLRGWGDQAVASLADWRDSGSVWSVSAVVGAHTPSGFSVKDKAATSWSGANLFRMNQQQAGPYELWDMTSGVRVLQGQAVSGDNALPYIPEAFLNPGHRFLLKDPTSKFRHSLWLPVRYGQQWTQIAGFAFEKVLFEPAEAAVGSPLFGFAVRAAQSGALAAPLTVQAWISLRSVTNGVIDDHVQMWNGQALLQPSLVVSYPYGMASASGYVGVGVPMPADPSLEGLVVLCQFVAECGGAYAISDVLGVGLQGPAEELEVVAQSQASSASSPSSSSTLMEARASARARLIDSWGPQARALATSAFAAWMSR